LQTEAAPASVQAVMTAFNYAIVAK